MRVKRAPFEWAAVAVSVAVLAMMLRKLTSADGLVLADGQPIFGDFIGFWSAGRAALDGHAAQVHDPEVIAAYQRAVDPDIAYVATWNGPPTFLLVMIGFALLPVPAAPIAFLTASAALFFYAARKLLTPPEALIFAATLPAALFQIGSVQTGLLVAGISGLALHWLDQRPRLSGALIGLLAIKPHLALLWPILLALSGRWRAFWAAAVSTTAFVLAAGFAFGFESYARFFDNLAASQSLIDAQLISTPAYASLYANLLGLGAPHVLAIAVHAISAAAAIIVAARAFLSNDRAAQGAALCAATLLISPYLFFYDFTLLAAGAALLGAPRNRLELAALILAWSAALSLPLGYTATLPLCPLAAWVVLFAAFKRRGESAAPRPAQAQHT